MAVLSGTTTTATLQLAPEAAGPALLLVGHAPENGSAQSDSASVAPGATGSVEITPVGFGMMRVHVEMEERSDEGRLTVHPPGPTNEAIQGNTNYPYPVVES